MRKAHCSRLPWPRGWCGTRASVGGAWFRPSGRGGETPLEREAELQRGDSPTRGRPRSCGGGNPLRPGHQRLHPHPVLLPRRRWRPQLPPPPLRRPPLPLGPPHPPRPRAPRPREPPACPRRRPRRRDGDDGAWSFTPDSPDALYGKFKLRDVYAARSGRFEGRASVPMLWDAERCEAVCNESIEITKFLCTLSAADDEGGAGLDLWPLELRREIDRWYSIIYPSVNNGVYRCGFAQSQEAYDTAASELFGTLDMLEDHLSGSRYLCADGGLTLADVCLFTTLIRFDLVYNPLFRCTKRKLVEYPSLHAYTREIYHMPRVAETYDMGAISDGYFGTLFPLNPGGILPVVPAARRAATVRRS